ncbi:hypothetical protein P7C73_g1852, partial [Tremellales sp. Uapishka_1]
MSVKRPRSASLDELSDSELTYEQERLRNIKENADLLKSLGLNTAPPNSAPKPKYQPVKKPRKLFTALPERRSTRVAALTSNIILKEEDDESPPPRQERFKPLPKSRAPILPGPDYASSSEVFVKQARPKRDAGGTLVFEGRWKGVFTPNLTPEEMFAGGAFSGAFFCDTYSKVLSSPLSAATDIAELPFTVPTEKLDHPSPSEQNNRFGVRAGQSLQEWEKAGWIWNEDPRGWAQWYVRFWDGRRCEDDERQVRRWMKVAGPSGRFKRALMKKIQIAGGAEALAEEEVGAVLRQCLWQWAYELTPSEWTNAMEE